MADSHKHLGIREEEWASFMEGLQEVCDELGLPAQEVDDVRAVIASMQADCVVADGEAVPPNPGHPPPKGDSLYARTLGRRLPDRALLRPARRRAAIRPHRADPARRPAHDGLAQVPLH